MNWLTVFFFQRAAFPQTCSFILFLYFADAALQVTSPQAHSANRFFSGDSAVAICSLVANATLLQLCGSGWRKLRSSHEVSPRFLFGLIFEGIARQGSLSLIERIFCKMNMINRTSGMSSIAKERVQATVDYAERRGRERERGGGGEGGRERDR